MSKKLLWLLVAVAVFFIQTIGAKAELGPPVSRDKKLIGWAVTSLYPAYLRDHISEIEQRLPFDGVIISVYPDDWSFARTGQEGLVFGGRPLTRDDYKEALADLKATKFNRFTDNFINIAACARGARFTGPEEGNLDWFDPNWSVLAQNAAVAAWLAKEAGFKGFMLDVEYAPGSPTPFGGADIFNYRLRPDKDKRTYEEVSAQVRKRGREWMETVTAVYPNISIMIQQNTGWTQSKPDQDRSLVAPFVDGMLEGSGPEARISDAGQYSYHLLKHKSFKNYRLRSKSEGAKVSKVPELFKKRIEQDLGVSFEEDYELRPRKDCKIFFSTPGELNKNRKNPRALEHTLYNALNVTDRYVWIYTGHGHYLYHPDLIRKENQWRHRGACRLCPHAEWPQEYTQAILNCRKPHDLGWNKFLTAEYYKSISGSRPGYGDAPLEERLRVTLTKSVEPDLVSQRIPGGKKPQTSALRVSPDASITDEGLRVIGDFGVEYDARILVFNWNGQCDYEMTIEFWHKYENGGRLLTIGQYDGSREPVPQAIYIAADSKGVQLFIDRAGYNRPLRAAYAFERGKWYHFALLYDPNIPNPFGIESDGVTRLYINGKEVIQTKTGIGKLNPDWSNDSVICLGGSSSTESGEVSTPGRGTYSDFVITRGLKYLSKFKLPARSIE